ncbi:hypothetical protein SPLC1_S060980 [Arthrospira platensis C1]|nr:hypothetical protein SPLC1_S060980 [Arthrospira platensis C1]
MEVFDQIAETLSRLSPRVRGGQRGILMIHSGVQGCYIWRISASSIRTKFSSPLALATSSLYSRRFWMLARWVWDSWLTSFLKSLFMISGFDVKFMV